MSVPGSVCQGRELEYIYPESKHMKTNKTITHNILTHDLSRN